MIWKNDTDLSFDIHAVRRMALRRIVPSEVAEALAERETVVLGSTAAGRRLKVVVEAPEERYVWPTGMRRTEMEIRYLTDAGAFYVTLGEGPVVRTAHISDDVMVDVEADGQVHGIELLCGPAELSADERAGLVDRFPQAAEALEALDRLTRLSA